ncbi:MAG: alpha/beta fold hydrolase [Hyphomicrobium sp.]
MQATLLEAQPKARSLSSCRALAPTDRDGNNPLGVAASSYRLLAEGLAAHGIASLRFDKRGMFGSRSAIPDANRVTIANYAADVKSWVAKARSPDPAPDCVWVLGHSEGGIVALAAAADPDICGLVLLATPGRRLGDLLREQLRANPANAHLLEAAFAAISALENGDTVDTAKLDPALAPLFHPAVQGFLRDAMAYDPATLIAAVDKPVLICRAAAMCRYRRPTPTASRLPTRAPSSRCWKTSITC